MKDAQDVDVFIRFDQIGYSVVSINQQTGLAIFGVLLSGAKFGEFSQHVYLGTNPVNGSHCGCGIVRGNEVINIS
jgi:hypothetical protein